MFTRPQVVGLAAVMLAGTLHAQDGPTRSITVETRIIQSEIQAALVRGTLELSLGNGTTSALHGVQLRLLTPASGVLGAGTVDLDDVPFDQTHVTTVEFVLDKAFVDSGEPLLLRVTYSDGSGTSHDTSLTTRLDTTGGGL